jgi:hypothetical protein
LVAHGFQSALSGSRFNQAPGFAGGCVTLDISIVLNLRVKVRGLLPEGILTKDICSKPD